MATSGRPFGHTATEKELVPIHRSHESQLPMKPDDMDPYGLLARMALQRYSGCPFEALKEGASDLKEDLEHAMDFMKTWSSKPHVEAKDQVWRQFMAHKSRPRIDALQEAKSFEATQSLLALSMMYRRLSDPDMTAVRKAAVYHRLIPPEDMAQYNTDWKTKAYYIVFPLILFFLSFAFQSFMLHVATAFYIRYMDRIEEVLPQGQQLATVEAGELFDLVARWVAKYASGEHPDAPEAVRNGNLRIPLSILDVSGLLPGALCAGAFLYSAYKRDRGFHIGMWYKTILIACCMAVMKGILDVVTILPDSIGWEQCKERLGDPVLQKMRSRQFFSDFWRTFWEAVVDEIVGVKGKRMRYCADMMLSGHTYFASLFSLAAYKLTGAIDMPSKVQTAVMVVCIICVGVEVVLVAAARFHYTVDMITSIFLVCLLWDSLKMEQICSDWSEGYQWRPPGFSTSGCCQGWTSSKEHPEVLPSQATFLINMRMLSMHAPWQAVESEVEDVEAGHETCPLLCSKKAVPLIQ